MVELGDSPLQPSVASRPTCVLLVKPQCVRPNDRPPSNVSRSVTLPWKGYVDMSSVVES